MENYQHGGLDFGDIDGQDMTIVRDNLVGAARSSSPGDAGTACQLDLEEKAEVAVSLAALVYAVSRSTYNRRFA